jgi:hypothetical protein
MATFTEHGRERRVGRSLGCRAVVAWLVLALLLCLPGCHGCSKSPEELEKEKQQAEEKARKKKEEEIKPFEAGPPGALPTGSDGTCKPGHWIGHTWHNLKANLGDFQGEVQTDIFDRARQRVQLDGVSYELTDRRPAALAKQQQKSLESFAWIPQNAFGMNFKLATAGGATAIERSMMFSPMPSYRYFFIVLSKGSRFDYLNKRLDSIRLHRSVLDSGDGRKDQFYEVVTMPPNRRPALPSHSLYWTSIAYLLWDESDPALWDLDQQQAVIDWLHWGGQIIVSGPDALQQLQNSFLRPFLPATVEKSRTFKSENLSELQCWAGESGRPPRPVRPWPGAELKKDPHAEYLPNTNDTVVEKRIGRGRIVASAFRITGPEFTGWEGCDCFFNACLMRRGAREIVIDATTGEKSVCWAGTSSAEETQRPQAEKPAVQQPVDLASAQRGAPRTPKYVPRDQDLRDAAKNTAIRYFSRDSGVPFSSYAGDVSDDADSLVDPDAFDKFFGGASDKKVAPGLGAWNDYSPVASAARKAVNDAARITVPPRSFIVWVVVGYLCVLVPMNWLFFRLIGRVEWAWIAAPLIAIGCTVVVVQQAQLNIGFARSQHEITVIEMQPGYARAHTTHYAALYTSLTTWYEFRLSEPGGQILPFPPSKIKGEERQDGTVDTRGELVCRRGDDTRLTGFRIGSHVVDCAHSEEMADFGGTVTLHKGSDGAVRMTNGTKHPLENCEVIRCDTPGSAETAAIDRLDPGATARLSFSEFNRQPEVFAAFLRRDAEPTLTDEGVRLAALHIQEMRPGEVCLVARIADDVPGLMVIPAAQQSRQAAILVAHLDPGKLPEPAADVRSRSNVRGKNTPMPDDSGDSMGK